jgi:HEAT repeat protein
MIGDLARIAGDMGEKPINAVPDLIQTLQDSDSYVRYCAASALGSIGPGAVDAVPALTLLLKDNNQLARHETISALGEIGPGAMQAVPALIQALGDENDRYFASRALADITGQDFGEDAAAWQQWWETQK